MDLVPIVGIVRGVMTITNNAKGETMAKQTEVIPANGEKCCACCGRFRRKLVLSEVGTWVGTSCAADIRLYLKCDNVNAFCWKGYEKQHAKVAKMFGRTTAKETA